MTEEIIEPGSIIGILGGGQLGAMFGHAACQMGYRVAVWDPDAEAPAHRIASHSFIVPFEDTAARAKLADLVRAVTFEWENVPAELCEWLAQRRRVCPSGSLLRIIQDRVEQKRFLQSRQLPVPQFIAIDSPAQLADAVKAVGFPSVCKTATSGYDGKGQWILRQDSDVSTVQQALSMIAKPSLRWILESVVNFERELSVLVVRGERGESRIYPVVENRHEQGILRLSVVPSTVSSDVALSAADLASRAVAELNGMGVFCVELFQTAGGLFINEVAPRPHNSGHYTLDACTVSQFEQQVRTVCGLPLGEARLLCPAAMVNLIGSEVRAVTSGHGLDDLLSISGAKLHLYGKRVVRPGRKMGHVTFLAERIDTVAEQAHRFLNCLG